MTILLVQTRRSVGRVAFTLALFALSACARNPKGSQAAIPNRSRDDLITEVRSRHRDLETAIQRGNLQEIGRHLAADAILVLPNRDTIRGPDAIIAQVERLHQTFQVEVLRGTAATGLMRCTDGVLERTEDWSMQVMKPDQTRDYLRDNFGIRWKASGDSLKISMVTLAAKGGVAPETADCVSLEAVQYSGSRISAFMALGTLIPMSYVESANALYAKSGYVQPKMQFPQFYPESDEPDSPAIIGVSGRVTKNLWLTVVGPRRNQNLIIGRCDREATTTNRTYININRQHFPIGFNADYHWGMLVVGAGPAVAHDKWNYQEVGLDPACGAGAQRTIRQEITRNENTMGMSGNITFNFPIQRHTSLTFRNQFFRFPAADWPALTATGQKFDAPDNWWIFGFGFRTTF
jgi:hypothetical protein